MPLPQHSIVELRARRAKAIEDSRAILDLARSEGRGLTQEEDSRWGGFMGEVEDLAGEILREERQLEAERSLVDTQTEAVPLPSEEVRERLSGEFEVGSPEEIEETPELREAFSAFFGANDDDAREARRAIRFQRRELQRNLSPEQRDLLASDDESAGFFVPYQEFVNQLIAGLDKRSAIRRLCRARGSVFPVRRARSLGAPKRKRRSNTFTWGAEVTKVKKGTDPKYGSRELFPTHLSGEIDVSRDLLTSSLFPPEQIVREEMEQDAGDKQEEAFSIGHGTKQPLGLFVNTEDGLSSAVDVWEDNTQTAITKDGLISWKYSLDARYWPNASILCSQQFLKAVAKIDSSGSGMPLWSYDLRVGQPDRILDFPFEISDSVPKTFAAGQYLALLGDFKYYWIADAMNLDIKRYDELEARENLVVFIGRLKTDGMPVLEEAFRRIQLAPAS